MKILLAVSLLLVSVASAVSIGFARVSVPAYYEMVFLGQETDETVHMLTVGGKLAPYFHIQGGISYSSETHKENDSYYYDLMNQTIQVYELGMFYQLASTDFASFSLGTSFMYSIYDLKSDDASDYLKTTGTTFSPLARVDFSIPGVDNLFLYSQYGFEYRSVKTEGDNYGYYYDDDIERTDFGTTAPDQILAGIYYRF